MIDAISETTHDQKKKKDRCTFVVNPQHTYLVQKGRCPLTKGENVSGVSRTMFSGQQSASNWLRQPCPLPVVPVPVMFCVSDVHHRSEHAPLCNHRLFQWSESGCTMNRSPCSRYNVSWLHSVYNRRAGRACAWLPRQEQKSDCNYNALFLEEFERLT